MYKCEACDKHYSSEYNLKKHKQRQPLCEDWLKMVPGIKDYIDDKFKLPMTDIDKIHINTKCFICNTIFANVGNLNRHLDTNIICSKWSMYKDLEPLVTYIGNKDNISYIPIISEFIKNGSTLYTDSDLRNDINKNENDIDSNKYEIFVSPKYSLCHIIWNIFLIDKEFASIQDMKTIIEENNIKYIIAILPDEEIYNEKIKIPICHTIMKYSDHIMSLDTDLFDIECNKIEEYRKDRGNIFVFCNNGYQRSIPFLCYYLLKFHNNEAPTIERAIDLILPQVDKANYTSMREKYIENMTLLFQNINLKL